MTAHAVAMTLLLVVVAVVFVMGSCQRKPVMSHSRFIQLPLDGWQRTMPLTFVPEYDDSTGSYDIVLAVRHAGSYRYRNLSLVVDVIAADSTLNRQNIDMTLADEYGNWKGGGFGTLYQMTAPVLAGITPDQARSVVVWQVMNRVDTLRSLESMGLITRPN